MSRRDKSVKVLAGKVGERFLAVVFNPKNESIVTVRVANRKERKGYDGM
jgi:uncharacterized DUF497 family protein